MEVVWLKEGMAVWTVVWMIVLVVVVPVGAMAGRGARTQWPVSCRA